MPRHPFEALSESTLGHLCAALMLAWAVLTAVLVFAVPMAHVDAMGQLIRTETSGAALELLHGWHVRVRVSLSFLLGFDLLYDVVHNNAVALALVWGAVRRGRAIAIARALAWVMWIDTGLNLVENLSLLHVIRLGAVEPWLSLGRLLFGFRLVTLVLGSAAAAVLHLAPQRASR